ncbi:hypothetical protein EDD85DRAFT_940532 [Armillaria nabsnona]|nr:hypothetical protein EDD85DRAFT_940532 [Armillaria nabsnona]
MAGTGMIKIDGWRKASAAGYFTCIAVLNSAALRHFFYQALPSDKQACRRGRGRSTKSGTGHHWIEPIFVSARCLTDIKTSTLSWFKVGLLGLRDGHTVFVQDVTGRRYITAWALTFASFYVIWA